MSSPSRQRTAVVVVVRVDKPGSAPKTVELKGQKAYNER